MADNYFQTINENMGSFVNCMCSRLSSRSPKGREIYMCSLESSRWNLFSLRITFDEEPTVVKDLLIEDDTERMNIELPLSLIYSIVFAIHKGC